MLGFTGALTFHSEHPLLPSEVDLKHHFGQGLHILEDNELTVGMKSNPKFNDDGFLKTDDQGMYGLDGVILNLRALNNQLAATGPFYTVKTLYQRQGYSFCKSLKGEFCGFIKDDTTKDFFLFSNQTNTKTFYYAYLNGILWFSVDMNHLVTMLKANGMSLTLEEESAYCLLSYGYMLENHTLFKEIKKLGAGSCLWANENGIKAVPYHNFANVDIKPYSRKHWIAILEEQFNEALEMEYEKDKAYDTPQHLTLISGGLDSRFNTMLAHKKGYRNKLNFCFSTSGYWDHTISRKIAAYLKEDYQLYPFDGTFLCDIEENTKLQDGIINYEDSAHFNEALKALDFSDFGLIHSGQIGDGVLGSLLTAPNNPSPGFSTGANSITLMPKITSFVNDILNQYEGEELFLLKNKVFNKVTSGSWVSEQFSYLVSPFMDVDFMETCLAIPPEMKYYEGIYLDWLKQYHPEVTQFRWERTKLKPNYKWKTKAGEVINMAQSVLLKKILGKEYLTTMTPMDYWYRHNLTIQHCIDNYVEAHRYLLDPWPELQNDAIQLFKTGSVIEKTHVLSLLEAIKQYHY